MKTTIQAADIQPGDRFVGGQVSAVTVGTQTVTIQFDNGQTAYYDRHDSVSVLRDQK